MNTPTDAELREIESRSQQTVERSQRLHTAISLLESACLTLERAENDGVRDLQQRVSRWCKQIRTSQQELLRELDKCNTEIVTLAPYSRTAPRGGNEDFN